MAITDQQQKRLREYNSLMTEVRMRLSCAITLIHEPPPGYPLGFVKEFCFLQIRMVCESIALGCLVAHGEMPGAQTKRLNNEYAPNRIMADLENLHPHFFPVKFTAGHDERGQWVSGTLSEEDPMTKKELIRLYGLCGTVLHRGSIEQFRSGKPVPDSTKVDAERWTGKLRDLLESHTMVLSGMDKLVVCSMPLASSGPVGVFLLEASE